MTLIDCYGPCELEMEAKRGLVHARMFIPDIEDPVSQSTFAAISWTAEEALTIGRDLASMTAGGYIRRGDDDRDGRKWRSAWTVMHIYPSGESVNDLIVRFVRFYKKRRWSDRVKVADIWTELDGRAGLRDAFANLSVEAFSQRTKGST